MKKLKKGFASAALEALLLVPVAGAYAGPFWGDVDDRSIDRAYVGGRVCYDVHVYRFFIKVSTYEYCEDLN